MSSTRKHKGLFGIGIAAIALVLLGLINTAFPAAGIALGTLVTPIESQVPLSNAVAPPAQPPTGVHIAADTKNFLAGIAVPALEPDASVPQAVNVTPAGNNLAATTPPAPAASAQTSMYCKTHKCIALTFDDGPGPYTHKLLATLRKQGAHATFFVIGNRVNKFRKLARQELTEGHQLCAHSWSHKNLNKMSKRKLRKDVTKTVSAIKNATAHTVGCMRPPYGAMSAKKAKWTGLENILWNVDTLDWKTLSTKKTIKAATKHAKRGQIILMHDIHKSTVKGVPKIISKLQHKGYKLVTVNALLEPMHPHPGRKYFGAK